MNKDLVKGKVDEHGEVHVVVEEHESVVNNADEDYIGLRKGEGYDYGPGGVTINDGSTKHYVPYERMVYLQIPTSFPD